MNKSNHFRGGTKMITVVATLPLLTACAGPKITALDVEIARHQAEAARACYAAHAYSVPEGGDARDVALIAMARALTGDPCRATNVYDSRAQIAAAQNQAVGRVVPGIVSGAVAVSGVIAGADVLKTAFRQSGNTTTTTITGDGNSAAHYDTRSANDYRLSSRGDQAPVSATADAAGPDQSTSTTTTTTEGAR